MLVDITTLTSTIVTTFLVPYVKLGVKKIGEEVGKQANKAAAEHVLGIAAKVWERVKSSFNSDAERATLTQFEKYPDDARPLVEAVLRDKLTENQELARELSELVNSPGPDGAPTGAQIMQAGIAGIVDMRNAQLSEVRGMTIGGVIVGSHSQEAKPAVEEPPERGT